MSDYGLGEQDVIDRVKGSPHPFTGGGVWLGVVGAVSGNSVSVRIPDLKISMTGQAVGVTALHQYKPKDLVAVALLNNDRQKCIILGRYNVVVDVFASKNIVTALTNAISALTARVEALEAGD
jgi:hypothetical protein